jgi:glucokinase
VSSVREVVVAADRGDETARSVLRAGGRALGEAIGSLANAVDPDLVVLVGGLTRAGPYWHRAVRAGVRDTVLPPLRELPVLPGACGDDAALLGAARRALEVCR